MLLRHSGLRWKRILSSNTLLLLHILLIRNLLLLIRGHVGRRWMYPATHPRLLRRDLGMINVFGRVDRRFTINSILVTRCRLWRIQTSLSSLQLRRKAGGEVRDLPVSNFCLQLWWRAVEVSVSWTYRRGQSRTRPAVALACRWVRTVRMPTGGFTIQHVKIRKHSRLRRCSDSCRLPNRPWIEGLMPAHLFHDARLPFRKSDVTARLILDELDLDLSPLATRLIVIVVIIVGRRADTRALEAAILCRRCTIAGRKRVILSRRWLLRVMFSDVGHCECGGCDRPTIPEEVSCWFSRLE